MMKKHYLYGALVSSTLLFTTSCNDNDLYDPNFGINTKPASEYFSFETTQNVTLQLNYGALAGNALVEVYDHNPVVSTPDGDSYNIEGEALYKAFLNQEGSINQTITLPAGVQEVWIYSHNWSAPQLVQPEFSNGIISYNAASTRAVQTRGALNTLSETLSATEVDKKKKIYTLVDWEDAYGTPIDKNQLYSEGDYDAQWISSIQHFLWRGFSSKAGHRIDNREYCAATDVVNTYISPDAKDEEGNPVESAQVWVTMLSESADYQNVVGYYFYKDGETPQKASDVEKYIIVPNNSIANSQPFIGGNSNPVDKAPMKINTRIQLLFKDKDGNFTPNFPVGYHIGYFLIQNAFYISKDKTTKGGINTGNSTFYSNSEWNAIYTDWQTNQRVSCLPLTDGALMYGIEDSGSTDWSAEDAAFVVTSTPRGAVRKPAGMPTIGPNTPVPDAVTTTLATYAFEDIWPSGGDYDLNDVMVEHVCKVTSNVSRNKEYVKKVEDTFTFVQPADAAAYTDAFAVQFNASQRGTIALPEGAIDETETGSIIVCENVKAHLKQSFTITRTFEGTSLEKNRLTTDLNPFIISQYNKKDEKRVEVHLPKHKATSKADPSLNNRKDDAYYIDKDGYYPFAISIPKLGFTPTTEKSPISVEYYNFSKWVNSQGKSNGNWYNEFKKLK